LSAGTADRVIDRLAALDAIRFTGRARLMALVDDALDGSEAPSVVLLHGPGGIGKSAVLREIGRRARARGRLVWSVDGRTIDPDVVALELVLDGAFDAPDPIVLLDAFEHVDALDGALRAQIIPRLAAGALVVVASRRPPDPAWLGDGWENVVRVVELTPFTPDEAGELLAHHGVTDPEAVEDIVEWAGGSPLAIGVAAASGTGAPLAPRDGAELNDVIVRRLAGEELHAVDRAVVEVAAVAYAVDGRMLATVLPGQNTTAGYRALRALTVAESIGSRVTLHEIVRKVLRNQLRDIAPDRYRLLAQRVADYLRDRIASTDPDLLPDLAELIDDPNLRWALVGERVRYRVDRVRPGDEVTAARVLDAADAAWWPGVVRYLRDAPDSVVVARDRAGEMAGFSIWVTLDNAPDWVDEDAVLGPWVAHARRHVPDGNVLIWRDEFDLESRRQPSAASTVTAALNAAAVRQCGLTNIRWFYGGVDPTDEDTVQLTKAMGARPVPELDVTDGGRTLLFHALDHGPGGFVDTVHALVYSGLGLPPPTPGTRSNQVDVEEALRAFDDADQLSASPFAVGSTIPARAEAVRTKLRAAIDAAFGDTADDHLLRTAIELGYLAPDVSHTAAAEALHLSRSTYFRRLRDARARVADALAHDDR